MVWLKAAKGYVQEHDAGVRLRPAPCWGKHKSCAGADEDGCAVCWCMHAGLILFCAAAPVAAALTYLVAGSVASMSDGRNVAL